MKIFVWGEFFEDVSKHHFFFLECWYWEMIAILEGCFRLMVSVASWKVIVKRFFHSMRVSKNERYSAVQVCPHFKSLLAFDSHFGYQDVPPIASLVLNQIHTLGSSSFLLTGLQRIGLK